MNETEDSSPVDQPTTPDQSVKRLVVAVALAAVAGVLILVLQILPAQFGIDLTGFGTYIGLTNRYETQQYYQRLRNTTEKQESVEIEVPAREDLEFKVYMLEGDQIEYQWSTGEGEVFFEFHGEPKGAHVSILDVYSSETAREDAGALTAPFEGTHGWYWRNYNAVPVTITLRTEGKYSSVGVSAAAFSR